MRERESGSCSFFFVLEIAESILAFPLLNLEDINNLKRKWLQGEREKESFFDRVCLRQCPRDFVLSFSLLLPLEEI